MCIRDRAYLAHCETPLSEEFGENVLKGISFLVDLGMKDVYKRQH